MEVIKTRFTTQTHKYCKEIVIRQKPTYGSKASLQFLVNRLLFDCYENYQQQNEDQKLSMLIRIHYLSIQMAFMVSYSDTATINIKYKDKPIEMICIAHEFNKKNKLFLNRDTIANIIILDYIKSVELKGEKFLEYYLQKHP